MGRFLQKTGMILTCGLLFITLATPGSAVVSTDEDDERCIIASRTNYSGDEYYADLFIGDVTFEDGQFYLNGEAYPNAIEKRIMNLLSEIEDSGSIPPNNPGNGNGPPPHHHLNQMNPVLNTVVNGVAGPAFDILEDLDLDDPPVVMFEVRLPSNVEDVDGIRVALILNTPICLSESEL